MILEDKINIHLVPTEEETSLDSLDKGVEGFFIVGKKVKALPRLAVFSKWWNN